MPNTGMLDHLAFRPTAIERRPRSVTFWMQPWPSHTGYETLRTASGRAERALSFSRHLHKGSGGVFGCGSAATNRGLPPSSRSVGNSLSPFHTDSKPTCGTLFSRTTDNRKKNIGIPPSNLVAWRSRIRA